jgi:hypothetical protein
MGGVKLSSWEAGRNLLHNNTVNNRVSKKEAPLKREEPVWITFDDWLWSMMVALLCDEEVRHALLVLEPEMPVIRF